MNARISAMLQYILCAFAIRALPEGHRPRQNRLVPGGIRLRVYLHNWLQPYVTSDSEASPATKARFPLREARVKVEENRSGPAAIFARHTYGRISSLTG